MSASTFDPFQDRLSRDIRNDLSASLLACIEERSTGAARVVAERFLAADPAPVYRVYIAERLVRYGRFLEQLEALGPDPLRQAFALWDLGLYFEVHEVLEQAWLRADGEEKTLLQALIRAAGVVIKRECGFWEAAAKMAAKARPVLAAHRDRLAAYTDAEGLLRTLDMEQ